MTMSQDNHCSYPHFRIIVHHKLPQLGHENHPTRRRAAFLAVSVVEQDVYQVLLQRVKYAGVRLKLLASQQVNLLGAP